MVGRFVGLSEGRMVGRSVGWIIGVKCRSGRSLEWGDAQWEDIVRWGWIVFLKFIDKFGVALVDLFGRWSLC
jgi:hypothetical protein